MNLFQKQLVKLSSGTESDFKIECDALTDEDIECCAYLISKKVKFKKVYGVPRGGYRLQKALEKYTTSNRELPILIVDDVLTTGKSMESFLNNSDWYYEELLVPPIGFVIFAREKCPNWIQTLFQM